MAENRRLTSMKVRTDAAAMAADRVHPEHLANGDEQRFASANYLMSFTKGLDHDNATGLVADAQHFDAFRSAIDAGFAEPFTRSVPVPRDKDKVRRPWEAPTAGVVYDLQGPDAQAVTMPPAPALCSDELTFEMAEVYELALLRDTPFNLFQANAGNTDVTVSAGRLNDLDYATNGFREGVNGPAGRPRKTDDAGALTDQTVFRGSAPGADKGPYLSQFLLIGSRDQGDKGRAAKIGPEQGLITYGAQTIDQRVLAADTGDDYMVKWSDWLEVQRGYRPTVSTGSAGQSFDGSRRFIYTPRDLATYVHYDQLYQAYLNACLILLGNNTPLDPGFDMLSGSDEAKMFTDPSSTKSEMLNAGGFALWGGPHILSLVTEIATRALKAVRYQKFNNHLRLRPEALAGRIEKAAVIEKRNPSVCGCLSGMRGKLMTSGTLGAIKTHNGAIPTRGASTYLLPMAFAEGSPMHPTYGAGHATVAGACVTVLKAFFDTSAIYATVDGAAGFYSEGQILKALDGGGTAEVGSYTSVMDNGEVILEWAKCGEFQIKNKGKTNAYIELHSDKDACCPLTLEGELNKLAANISIGRNMAGVHYFSDYYDSLRMGEEIAIGMLQEQAICYPTDPFVMSLNTFDGKNVRIGAR